ncbi:hypothetical protein PYCC9005_002355 [Savitreella phatthalungensis]
MPSHALLLLSKSYFASGGGVPDLGNWAKKHITAATGTEFIDVACAVVDDIALPDSTSSSPTSSVSLLLVSEDERAKFVKFDDEEDRTISLGRAWKDQGESHRISADEKDNDDASEWDPEGRSWKDILSGTDRGSTLERNLATSAETDFSAAVIVGDRHFGSVDWPTTLLPNAEKVGVLAAETPFLTGRRMTVALNGHMIESGGIALAFRRAFAARHVTRQRLRALAAPDASHLKIDKCQGNILISLDGAPATYALLAQLNGVLEKDQRLSKDVELYGEVFHAGDTVTHADKTASEPFRPVIKVTSGDPGKGSIALNGGYKVSEGDKLRLHYDDPTAVRTPSHTTADLLAGKVTDTTATIAFIKLPPDAKETYASSDQTASRTVVDEAESVVEGLFTAGSETGLVFGRGDSQFKTWLEESIDTTIVARP